MKRVFIIIFLFFSIKLSFAQKTEGIQVAASIVSTDSTDEYYTHSDYFGLTMWKSVKNIAQLYLLPMARRQEGMRVYVQDIKKTYRFADCTENECLILDRIDTLIQGTVSTGTIEVKPDSIDPTFLYSAYTHDGYQRFGVTKNGFIIAGRLLPLYTNVDGLFYFGHGNDLTGTNAGVIGKFSRAIGDSSFAFGNYVQADKYNAMVIGMGPDSAHRIKSRFMNSVAIGAGQDTAQIEITKDTIRHNAVSIEKKQLFKSIKDTGISIPNLYGIGINVNNRGSNPFLNYTSYGSGEGLYLTNSGSSSGNLMTMFNLGASGAGIHLINQTSSGGPAMRVATYSGHGLLISNYTSSYFGIGGYIFSSGPFLDISNYGTGNFLNCRNSSGTILSSISSSGMFTSPGNTLTTQSSNPGSDNTLWNNSGMLYWGSSAVGGSFPSRYFKFDTVYYNFGFGLNPLTNVNNYGLGNSVFGFQCGYSLPNTAYYNTLVGYKSNYWCTGGQNTSVGANAANRNIAVSNGINLGYMAGYWNTALSNRLFINSLNRTSLYEDTTLSIIYGAQASTTADQRLRFNSNVNISNNLNVTGTVTSSSKVTGTSFYVSSIQTAPSTSTDTGTTGELRICADGIYICISTNTWIKCTGSTF